MTCDFSICTGDPPLEIATAGNQLEWEGGQTKSAEQTEHELRRSHTQTTEQVHCQ